MRGARVSQAAKLQVITTSKKMLFNGEFLYRLASSHETSKIRAQKEHAVYSYAR